MHLVAFGLNHDTAPLAIRERVAFHADNLRGALQDLVNRQLVHEATIVSTCNRTEIYCNTRKPTEAMAWLAQFHHLPGEQLQPYLYQLQDTEAVRHAFRVASGLDSMVLGEAQILGQIKDAVRDAEAVGALGTLLHKLFQQTFTVAKEVRTRTEIGAGAVSMAAAALRLAERIYPSVRETKVLFIGAGEMIELCATHFAAHHPQHIGVANRTRERATRLAERFGGEALALPELSERLAEFDIVVSSTASPLPIIGKGMLERALKARKRRPMFVVDLAVPRDVEPEVAELDDVYLYTVDDLAGVVNEGLAGRQQAMVEAERIIDGHVQAFAQWLDSREVVPVIRALHDHTDRIRRAEMDKALKRLARGEAASEVLEAFGQGLMAKFLHPPTQALNQIPADQREELVAQLRRLYHLHDSDT